MNLHPGPVELTAQIAGILLAILGLLLYVGFGITWMLRTRRLAPVLPLFTPVVGIATLAVAGHALAYLPVGTDQTLWPLLAAFTLINLWACWQGARPTLRRSQAAALPGAALALALALLPFYDLGYLTIAGREIDAISYVSRAEWLRRYGLMVAPASGEFALGPLLEGSMNIGMREGDTYLLALVSSALHVRPHFVFPVLMAVLYALTPIGIFVLAVAGLRMRRSAAMLAGLLVAVQPLTHWAIIDTFLSQAAGVAVWPFVLTSVLVAVTAGSGRAIVLAALLVAMMATIYQAYLFYMALLVALIALGVGVTRGSTAARASTDCTFWRRAAIVLRPVTTLLTRGFAVAALAIVLAPVAWILTVRMTRALAPDITREGIAPGASGGMVQFPHIGELFGLVNHFGATYGVMVPQLPSAGVTGLFALATASVVYGTIRIGGRRRWMALAIMFTFAVALGHQRFWLDRGFGYPYGYFKVLSLAVPMAMLLTLQGALLAYRNGRRRSGWRRAVGVSVPCILLSGLFAVASFHLLRTMHVINRCWLSAERSVLEVETAAGLVPRNEPLLTIDESFPQRSWTLYLLDHSLLYDRDDYPVHPMPPEASSSELVRYALAFQKDGREGVGGEPWFDPARSEVLWDNGRYRLLRRTDDAIASMPLRRTELRQSLAVPVQVEITGATVRVSGGSLSAPLGQRIAGYARAIRLVIDSTTGGTAVLDQDGVERPADLAKGSTLVQIPAETPTTVRVRQAPGTQADLIGIDVLGTVATRTSRTPPVRTHIQEAIQP